MTETKRAGIVIDPWKLPIFERRLRAAGFSWEHFPGKKIDTLRVVTADLAKLAQVVADANEEAAQSKRRGDTVQ